MHVNVIDRIITLSTCNSLQCILLQCNVVIRESFLFRYSAIPLFLIPRFTTSPVLYIYWIVSQFVSGLNCKSRVSCKICKTDIATMKLSSLVVQLDARIGRLPVVPKDFFEYPVMPFSAKCGLLQLIEKTGTSYINLQNIQDFVVITS